MSLRLAVIDAYVRSTLECGGSTPPCSYSSALWQGGVEPPHSKVLRTAIFVKAAVIDSAAKDLGKSAGSLTNIVEIPHAGLNRLRKNSFWGPKIDPIHKCANLESTTCERFNRPSWPIQGVFPQPVKPGATSGLVTIT
jgi:hypothetical protein